MNIGRVLIVAGLALVALGLVFILFAKLHIPLGRLPGDVVWRGRNTTFYFPVVTCILLSLLASFLLWLFNRR
ncbi:MAG TPA: DUF2905 domain-containing protein [Bryobacteraceae bacterium]|nr:DUF2905 domain-containing protein [Bryobacteraceae bacterium]